MAQPFIAYLGNGQNKQYLKPCVLSSFCLFRKTGIAEMIFLDFCKENRSVDVFLCQVEVKESYCFTVYKETYNPPQEDLALPQKDILGRLKTKIATRHFSLLLCKGLGVYLVRSEKKHLAVLPWFYFLLNLKYNSYQC